MPAAAVIPAPIAYIKFVAVEKLVVGFLQKQSSPLLQTLLRSTAVWCRFLPMLSPVTITCTSLCGFCLWELYFEEIRVFQAGVCFEYISME